MKLSIIIVNYKSPQLLIDCLSSIYKFETNRFEIIVVDNYSQDNTADILKQQFPAVAFIQMGYNAGFARANNAGIKASAGDAVLLLNTDTININDAINQCFSEFSSSNAAACGVQLLNDDHTPQISGNYAMKGGINYLLPLPFWGQFLKYIADLFKVKKPNLPDSIGSVEVDWINGAFLMVKKSAIDKAGLLDEDFFLYAEEAEWCSRLKRVGSLFIFGQYKVVHLQGKTANEAFGSTGKGYFNLFDTKGLQIMLSNFVRIRKEFGVGWMLFDLANYVATIPVFFIGVSIEKIFKGNQSNYQFKQWKAYSINVIKLIGFVPKIIANKPYFYKIL